MTALACCPACSRHARVADPDCPFCGASLGGAVPGEVRAVSRREVTRSAIVLGAASLLGACASGESAEDDDQQQTTGGGELTDDERDDQRWEDRRRRPPCDDGDEACMTMPYGAPAMPEPWV